MATPMHPVSGSGLSILVHSSILFSLMAASALHVSPLPDPTPAHGPMPSFNTVTLKDPAGGGAPAPRKGSSNREPLRPTVVPKPPTTSNEIPASQAAIQPRPEESSAFVEPETADHGSDPDGASSPDGDPNGRPDGLAGGIGDGTGDGNGGPGLGSGSGTGGPGSDDTFYIDGSIAPPVLLVKLMPVYPEVARAARIEATLRFEIVVDERGNVSSITPLKSHPLFEQDATNAIRQWKYRPATIAGVPVKVYLLVMVEFKLR